MNQVLGFMEARNELNYEDLMKSCDIGLSTVIFHRDLIKMGKFPKLKTKEDYVLWLNFSKNNVKIVGIKECLASWRRTRNSLSDSVSQKLIDAFRVYYIFQNKNLFKSILNVLILSIYYLKKRFLNIKD
jgi:teichuronic acid biosynthesis glycosyltransferase TuaG